MRVKLVALFLLAFLGMNAQNAEQPGLPFAQIPDHPDTFTGGNLVARMIDGVGFRYYWATEGLHEENLSYRPTPDNRSIGELLRHVYGLTGVILNSARKLPNDRSVQAVEINNLEMLREKTLLDLEEARRLFAGTSDLAAHKVIFVSSEGTTEFPFWNQINGALEDAVWHSGQIATLRRAAGNPMAAGVDPFLGVTKK